MKLITASALSWQAPIAWDPSIWPLHLAHDTVHVWRFWLHQPDSRVHDYFQLLSAPEQRRTIRFYSGDTRKRFIIAHGILRRILSSYLNTAPTHLKFNYQSHGKPFLTGSATEAPPLQFNLTHAQDLALCAVTATRRLGIDLEWVHDHPHIQTAISAFCSLENTHQLARLPLNQRLQTFYEMWTRREAYLKALGTGLYRAPFPGDPHVMELPRWHSDKPSWTTIAIEPALNYIATLVIEGHDVNLRYLHYPLADDEQHQSKIPITR